MERKREKNETTRSTVVRIEAQGRTMPVSKSVVFPLCFPSVSTPGVHSLTFVRRHIGSISDGNFASLKIKLLWNNADGIGNEGFGKGLPIDNSADH